MGLLDLVLWILIISLTEGTPFMVLVLSPFLIGWMFLREPSWKYSAKLVGS